jgi:hypothetical protein
MFCCVLLALSPAAAAEHSGSCKAKLPDDHISLLQHSQQPTTVTQREKGQSPAHFAARGRQNALSDEAWCNAINALPNHEIVTKAEEQQTKGKFRRQAAFNEKDVMVKNIKAKDGGSLFWFGTAAAAANGSSATGAAETAAEEAGAEAVAEAAAVAWASASTPVGIVIGGASAGVNTKLINDLTKELAKGGHTAAGNNLLHCEIKNAKKDRTVDLITVGTTGAAFGAALTFPPSAALTGPIVLAFNTCLSVFNKLRGNGACKKLQAEVNKEAAIWNALQETSDAMNACAA